MANKHFINDPTHLVATALRSAPLTNPSLALDEENKVVYCRSCPKSQTGRVAIVSGGGAGHEPSFVSFVGDGLLRAAVSGSIFASPSVKQIYHCITQRVNPNAGVLLIVMNYTGDVLHFGLAAEKAKAAGMNVEMVVVADDVGVGREKSGKVGRRGIAGTVLVHKISGALAATGASLSEVSALAALVAGNIVSVGSSLAHVHVPGRVMSPDDDNASLRPDEIEIGMGIHNEQGYKRVKIPELPELVKLLLGQLLDKEDQDRNYLGDAQTAEGWVLMVNNLGGVSPLEMGGITTEVVKQLDSSYFIKPKRIFSSAFMTSLNGNGFSISLLRLVDTGLGDSKTMLKLLDAPHEALGWPAVVKSETWDNQDKYFQGPAAGATGEATPPSGLKVDVPLFSKVLSTGLEKLISAEAEISRYDEIVGDGDCGAALKNGAEAVLMLIKDGKIDQDAVITVTNIATAVEDSMGGTSGAIYSIFINSLAKALRELGENPVELQTWAVAAAAALLSLRKYTPAQPGDRTLVDALQPFVVSLVEDKDIQTAAKAARRGAESTRRMKASLGRTVYIGQVGDTPDPGAIGVAVLVEGFAEGALKGRHLVIGRLVLAGPLEAEKIDGGTLSSGLDVVTSRGDKQSPTLSEPSHLVPASDFRHNPQKELYHCPLRFPAEMSLKPDNFRPALLIVDFQEDFCPPNGSLAVQDGRGIAPTVNELLRLPFALKVATRDWHPRNHISFASNHPAPENIPFISHTTIIHPSDPTREYTTRLWPDHCIQGSPGAELVPELDLSLVDEIVDKGQDPRLEMYSAFTDPFHLPPFTPDSASICTSQLAQTLAERKISHVYVVGLTQDYCVKDSAIDAAKFGFKTFVIREGTRAVDPGKWDQAERDMAGAGVATIGLEDREVQDWVGNFKKD